LPQRLKSACLLEPWIAAMNEGLFDVEETAGPLAAFLSGGIAFPLKGQDTAQG
jgi:hypothetical protein